MDRVFLIYLNFYILLYVFQISWTFLIHFGLKYVTWVKSLETIMNTNLNVSLKVRGYSCIVKIYFFSL